MRSDTRSNAVQEGELISRLGRLFLRGMSSRAPRAAALLAVVAILCAVTPAQTPEKTAAHPRAHAASASDPTDAAAPVKAMGNKSAPITLEIFSDYQCPSCGQFFKTTLRPMISEYVAGGKVYLVHHDFPLQKHAYSGQAARWANAAAKIGKFQEVDAALFDSQDKWTADGDMGKSVAEALGPADFKRVQAILKPCTGTAPTAKVDGSLPQIDHACSVDSYIVQDIALGYQLPVTGTPTFVIHYKGKSYPGNSGPVSWPILKQFFDTLLSQ